MARLFISHSSVDNVRALAFVNWLTANGWNKDDIFVDLHDIGAGHRWRETLRKANRSCEAVILLASPEALDSGECQNEVQLAEGFGKEVIVALLRDIAVGDPRLSRFSERQFVDLSAFPQDHTEALTWDGREHRVPFNVGALARIKKRLEELGIAPESFPWPPKGVRDPEPYPGLAAFGEEDAGIFFGRDANIMKVLNDIRLVRRRRSPRLIVIDAASGAGKSSFLRAGLWPRLRRDSDFAPLAVLRPAQGILSGPDGLGRKIAPWFDSFGQARAPGSIHTPLLATDEDAAKLAFRRLISEAVELATHVRRAVDENASMPAPVIAIDQGEELFAPENDVESRRFLELLANVLNDPPANVDPYVIITIRADSREALLRRITELSMEQPDPNYLDPLSAAAYWEVIVRPAEVYSARVNRVSMDPQLVNALVEDTTGGDALPLLAFALSRMFVDFKAEGELTYDQYRQMGGIGGSIGRALKQAQVRAGAVGTDAHLRRLLLPGLATWDPDADGEKGAAKRLVAKRSEIVGGPRADLAPLADALVEARLLTRGHDTLEVAHEALLRTSPLEDWLLEDRDFLAWRHRLGKARAAYQANTRGLLVGRELEIAREQLIRRSEPEDIAPQDQQFIRKSIEEDDRRRTREEERERKHQEAELAAARAREEAAEAAREAAAQRAAVEQEKAAATALKLESAQRLARRNFAGAMALLLAVVALAGGGYFFQQLRTVQLTQSTLILGRSEELRSEGSATKALSQALEAMPEGEQLLAPQPLYSPALKVIKEARYERRELRVLRAPGQVTSTAFSPDEALAATGSNDNVVRLWNTRDGSLVAMLGSRENEGSEPPVINSIAFSPDGARLAVGSTGSTVSVWDVASARRVADLSGHSGPVTSVSFSRDGKRILTASSDGSAFVWQSAESAADTWQLVTEIYPEADNKVPSITAAAFDPSARRVLLGFESGENSLWSDDGQKLLSLPNHADPVSAVAFSPDGALLLTASHDKTVDIFDASSTALKKRLAGHQGKIYAAAFGASRATVVTASADGSIRLWDADTGSELVSVRGHDGRVLTAAFSASGDHILTGSDDGTARLWNARGPVEIATLDNGVKLKAALFISDGANVVTAGEDGRAKIWTRAKERVGTELLGHSDQILSLAISPDQTKILTGSKNRTARLWDAESGRLEQTYQHKDEVEGVIFSSDGTHFVARQKNGAAILWSNAGSEVARIEGGFINAASFSPDQRRILIGTNSGYVRLWNVASRAIEPAWANPCEGASACPRKHEYAVNAVHFSPKGDWAVSTGHDNIAKIWDLTSANVRAGMNLSDVAYAVAIHPSGERIAFGLGNGDIKIYQPGKAEPLAVLSGHGQRILALSYSANGATLLSSSQDQTARLWDAATYEELAALRGHRQEVTGAAFAPDGRSILTASADGTARIWPHWTDPKELIRDTRDILKPFEAMDEPASSKPLATSSD